MVSILVPISYLAFLFGSLAIFSRYYRRAQAKKPVKESWFPQHKSRDLYVSLLSLEPPPARPILIAALLRRAMDDVKLIWSIRDSKSALQTLLTKGQIGDELWERFQEAEKELEAEIVEVAQEANTFQEGYGQQIFGIASEMVNHEKIKEAYEKIADHRKIQEAKMTAGPTSKVLAPTTYLTPASLTLAPSNPLTASAPVLDAKLLPDDLVEARAQVNAQAPLDESATTPKPTSPVSTPKKLGSAPSSRAASNGTPSKPTSEDDGVNETDDDIDVPIPSSAPATPGTNAEGGPKTPSKGNGAGRGGKSRGAMKKKVKGGR